MRKVQSIVLVMMLVLGVCGCGVRTIPGNGAGDGTTDSVAESVSDTVSAGAEETVSGDVIFLEAIEDYKAGNLTTAIEKFEKAGEAGVKSYTEDVLYSCIGGCYLDLDMYDEAIEYYNKAMELAPDDVRHVVNLAIAYRQSGDNAKAKELYIEALKIDPNYAELNSSLGTLYALENNPEMAIRCFERAIELDPDLAVAYGNGAYAYALAGDFEKADSYLETAISKGYTNADAIKEKIDALR